MTEQRVSYTLDSSLETIDSAEEKATRIATQLGFADDEIMQISMAVREGAVNAVLHGNAYAPDKKVTLSFQWWRALISVVGLAFLNFGPFLGVFLAHGWARVPYAIALGSMFAIYTGMSRRSAVPAYYFLLHPVSAALFIYTLLRSMCVTLWNDGIEWRGTKYPLEELRKGMV